MAILAGLTAIFPFSACRNLLSDGLFRYVVSCMYPHPDRQYPYCLNPTALSGRRCRVIAHLTGPAVACVRCLGQLYEH